MVPELQGTLFGEELAGHAMPALNYLANTSFTWPLADLSLSMKA